MNRAMKIFSLLSLIALAMSCQKTPPVTFAPGALMADGNSGFVIRPGLPLRMMESNWQKRAMQFVDIPSGDLNMTRYVECLIHSGYPQRYCEVMKTKTAPLIAEAESAYRDLDATSANAIEYVRDNLVFPIAAGSFEEGMGA